MNMTTMINNRDILHLLTGRTPMLINRLISVNLKKNEITLTKEQWSVMAVLWMEDGVSQQDLADATYRDRPGITRLVDNLEKEGWVERKPHATDRRTNLIFLTNKGKEIEKSVVKVINDTIDEITKDIKTEQLIQLRETFEQINQNIQNLSE